MHTGEPVAHDVVPVLQALVGWQLEPAAHDTHVPALQTLSVPQPAPLASALPVSVQAMLGEQTVMPAWHGFAGTQLEPAEQVAQLPAWQTMFAPQALPFATSPDSMQTGVPVLQAMVPLRQGLPGTTQSMPCTQAPQAPVALQTMSVPHDVPAVTFVLVSVHDGAAPEQTSAPVWHLFVGVHAPPIWQVAHVPAWQTMPVPHVVPFGLLSVSVQTGAPVAQTMLPTRQGLPVTSQSMPVDAAVAAAVVADLVHVAAGAVRLQVGQLHARHGAALEADEHSLVTRVGRHARPTRDAGGRVDAARVHDHRRPAGPDRCHRCCRRCPSCRRRRRRPCRRWPNCPRCRLVPRRRP